MNGTSYVGCLFAALAAAPAPSPQPPVVPAVAAAAVRIEVRSKDGRSYFLTGPDALLYCIQARDDDGLRRLLAEGHDLNARVFGGTTFLHLAARSGSAEAVELLLLHGADPKARLGNGATPLDVAADAGRPDLVRLLRKHLVR